MKKFIKYICLLSFISLMLVGCEDILNTKKLDAINADEVWNNADLANAFLNNSYASIMPRWPDGAGDQSEEANADSINMNGNTYLKGTANIPSDGGDWPYSNIRDLNTLIANIDGGTCSDASKASLKGQALFLRAWLYFRMVKNVGGVPLVLEPTNVSDGDALFVPRNKTSECITQIEKDLDDAANYLGDTQWDSHNTGRIDKSAILAFKGRVALFWASPLFNPSNIQSRWQQAYDINKAAVDYCQAHGKGLYPVYGDIWNVKDNSECIMERKFSNPDATYFQGGLRPLIYSKDMAWVDHPTLEIAQAFPMKDGTVYDPTKIDYRYFYENRDDRFYATIAYNGAAPYLKEMFDANTRLWSYVLPDGTHADEFEPNGGSMDQGGYHTYNGFYRIKGLDRTITKNTVYSASTDWIEIRFAEVLMNMGEAANAIGKTDVALDVLHQIRKRAGIEAGVTGNYGITATGRAQVSDAYFNERFVEFAFEGKRWDDIRRLRKFDYMLHTVVRRHGLYLYLKNGAKPPMGMDDPSSVADRFTVKVFRTDQQAFALKESYYFAPITKNIIDRNSKIEQNVGWGNGTFNPLL